MDSDKKQHSLHLLRWLRAIVLRVAELFRCDACQHPHELPDVNAVFLQPTTKATATRTTLTTLV